MVVGGVIPPGDAEALQADGVARVFTPKDYDLGAVMGDIVALMEHASTRSH